MPRMTVIMGPAVGNQILNLTPSLLHLLCPCTRSQGTGPELRGPAGFLCVFLLFSPVQRDAITSTLARFLRVEGLLLLEPICFLHM